MRNTTSNPTISEPYTKTVLYYGKEIQLPNKAKWIHTDSNGVVFWSTKQVHALITCFDTVSGKVVYGSVGSLFNHTEMSSINWMLSQKRISDLPSVRTGLEQVPHPHADLMLKYAQIAQYSDKPWEEFQFRMVGTPWIDCITHPDFYPITEYRLKPQTVEPVIQVGQVWEHSVGVRFVVTSVVQSQYLKDIHVTLALELHGQSKVIHRVTEAELQQHFTLIK